jgi:oligosaccharide repeat unit polymerase
MLFLFDLGVVNYYQETKDLTKFLILTSVSTFFISWFLLRMTKPIKLRPKISSLNINIQKKIFSYTLMSNKIWISGFVLEAILQKGFPLFWIFIGDGRTYADFGFSSVHGFLTSFYFFSLLTTFLLFIVTKNKKYLKYTFLFFLYPILAINRGVLILGLAQLFAVYMFFNGLNYKNILKIIFSLTIVIYVFGLIGELRIGKKNINIFHELISDNYKELFVEKLPIGFTWSYIYFTASLDNVNENIDKIQPNYYPKTILSPLIPSFISKKIFKTEDNYEDRYIMKMTNPLINTFTYYAPYLLDFGIYGTLIFLFFLQFIINYIYIMSREGNLKYQLIYPVFLSSIFLSVFTDYLFNLVVIMEIVILYYVGKRSYLIK